MDIDDVTSREVDYWRTWHAKLVIQLVAAGQKSFSHVEDALDAIVSERDQLRAALIAVLPFIDDACDVHGFMFPDSAASNECRAAVVAAKAAIAKAEGVKS